METIHKSWNLLTDDELRAAIAARNNGIDQPLVGRNFEVKVIGRDISQGKGDAKRRWVHSTRGSSQVGLAAGKYIRCIFVRPRVSKLAKPVEYTYNVFDNDPLYEPIRQQLKKDIAKEGDAMIPIVDEEHNWADAKGNVTAEDSPTIVLSEQLPGVFATRLSVPQYYITRSDGDGHWHKIPTKRRTNFETDEVISDFASTDNIALVIVGDEEGEELMKGGVDAAMRLVRRWVLPNLAAERMVLSGTTTEAPAAPEETPAEGKAEAAEEFASDAKEEGTGLE